MNENVIATKPRVVISSSKKWYVYFQVRDPRTGRLHPVKIEKGFKLCINDDERREIGKKMVREYTAKLKKGWTPWSNDEFIFEDQIAYKHESMSYGSKRKSKATIRMLASEYLKPKKLSLKPKGYSSYQSKFRIFTLWLENNGYEECDVSTINNKVILRFFEYLITERKLDKVTIKNYRVRLNSLFNWLKKEKRIIVNPVFDTPTGIKTCDKSARPILPSDIDELLDKIEKNDPQLYLACLMQYFCAIRPGTELRLLKIQDIDFWNGTIHINLLDSKTGRSEVICIPSQLKKIMTDTYRLQKYESGLYVFSINGIPGSKPLGKNNMRMRFNKYRDELSLSPEYKFYSFKHTGAGMMLDCGKFNIRELMEHLRHTDINSTFHYIRRYKGSTDEKIKEHFPDPYKNFN
ncbi:MAG: site-specific integrase [Odoribacter sp.]